MSNANGRGKKTLGHDEVCNSYLESYKNFSDSSGSQEASISTVQKNSKKGKIDATLAALELVWVKEVQGYQQSPSKKSSQVASSTTTRIRPESIVRRGLGDMGLSKPKS
jgi:hypothetical protein